jgi:hypothetical protein
MTTTSHTPPLTDDQLKAYLKINLANELQWSIRAAVEWQIQARIKLKISGYHMQVLAMDSTFLHTRTLFEFFTKRATGNHYGYDTFRINMIPVGASAVPTPYLTEGWEGALHAYLMHAQDRTVPNHLTSYDRTKTKHIKNMPVDFAHEIVRLWREFATQLGKSADPNIRKLEPIALKILSDATAQTEEIYTRKKVMEMKRKFPVKPIVW